VGDTNGGGFSERLQSDGNTPQNSTNGDSCGPDAGRSSTTHWSNFDLLPCLDGKTRRIESGTFPLAHGVPGRVGLLRGYGNAIVPQVAAEFVSAFLES
jgi:hypothetical protein